MGQTVPECGPPSHPSLSCQIQPSCLAQGPDLGGVKWGSRQRLSPEFLLGLSLSISIFASSLSISLSLSVPLLIFLFLPLSPSLPLLVSVSVHVCEPSLFPAFVYFSLCSSLVCLDLTPLSVSASVGPSYLAGVEGQDPFSEALTPLMAGVHLHAVKSMMCPLC